MFDCKFLWFQLGLERENCQQMYIFWWLTFLGSHFNLIEHGDSRMVWLLSGTLKRVQVQCRDLIFINSHAMAACADPPCSFTPCSTPRSALGNNPLFAFERKRGDISTLTAAAVKGRGWIYLFHRVHRALLIYHRRISQLLESSRRG
jgi:hypothetical protein